MSAVIKQNTIIWIDWFSTNTSPISLILHKATQLHVAQRFFFLLKLNLTLLIFTGFRFTVLSYT